MLSALIALFVSILFLSPAMADDAWAGEGDSYDVVVVIEKACYADFVGSGFVDSLLADADNIGCDLKIGVVGYYGKAEVLKGFEDEEIGAFQQGVVVNGKTKYTGSNLPAGILLGKSMLDDDSSVIDPENKCLVVIGSGATHVYPQGNYVYGDPKVVTQVNSLYNGGAPFAGPQGYSWKYFGDEETFDAPADWDAYLAEMASLVNADHGAYETDYDFSGKNTLYSGVENAIPEDEIMDHANSVDTSLYYAREAYMMAANFNGYNTYALPTSSSNPQYYGASFMHYLSTGDSVAVSGANYGNVATSTADATETAETALVSLFSSSGSSETATYSNTVSPLAAWTHGDLEFRFELDGESSATFSHFTGIKVDNVAVSSSNYDAVSGSVVVTLHEDYVATLSPGSHTLTALFDDGEASASFTTEIAIPMTLTLDASKATDTEGMTFTFNPAAEPVVAEEEGAFAVPRYDSNNDNVIDENDGFVMPSATTLTALAMSGDTQDIEGALALPDPSLYGHAGVYAYTVTEDRTSVPANWDYSEASYKVRVYVKNGANGLEYAETPIKIEALTDDAGDPVAKEQGSDYGPKVQRMLFTNVNTATTSLEIAKQVTGAYGNRSKAFPFTLTVTLPSWASDDSFAVTTTGSDLSGATTSGNDTVVTTTSGAATITFRLAHGQSLSVAGLPVGTTFSAGETDSTDGVNVYAPTATYFYDGASGATGDYADNTQNYSADLDANSQPTDSITVYASAASAAANAATMLGEGAGNLVTVTNDLSNPPSPTGVAIKLMPYILMALVGCGLFVALRRRKAEDDLA